ncbi:WXG100 family type VII secretion target [Cellulomonas bogoriensis]|uniref:PPE family domain-containing protein n=1 Tax=Cellulomonas bogoriensis 69B4 = DSM 16987 TaxID=1386082 RepID=A0A0A0C317_9CELL|nr:hypothetical protein [Cellulomonas bogoriensis]KGM14590.1 hypothetical protein N869_05155 [Cellulomonas bogoriensis 69B4 = DSM 16987]
MTVTETVDPRTVLAAPSAPPVDMVRELQSSAGLLLGGLDWLLVELTGTSALENFVKPLAGDWSRLAAGAEAWSRTAVAVDGIATNLGAAGDQVTGTWTGPGAEAFSARARMLAEDFHEYGDGCRVMAEVTEALFELCQATAETIASILGFIGDALTRIAIQAAIPVAGWVTGTVDGAVSSGILIFRLQRAYQVLQTLLSAVERYRHVITTVVRIAAILERLARLLSTTANIGAAGGNIRTVTMADGAVAQSFGVSP